MLVLVRDGGVAAREEEGAAPRRRSLPAVQAAELREGG